MDQATNTLFRKETALAILIILNIVSAVCLANNVIEKRYKQPLERISPDLDDANTTMTDTRTGATNQPTVVPIEIDDLTLEKVEAILIKCGKILDRVTEGINDINELIIEFEKQRKNE
jgi:hypothetical protein